MHDIASKIITLLIAAMLSADAYSQKNATEHEQIQTVMFWNVENLFDADNNPDKNDDEFTPKGTRHWTNYRLHTKVTNIARAINDAGKENGVPSIIGMAEVENDSVMTRLLSSAPLYRHGYRYIITQSDDVRGINVALAYIPMDFRLIGHQCIKVSKDGNMRPTRDILHAWGRIIGGDTLDVIVCHLPSRLGGVRQNAQLRKRAHLCIKSLCDSIDHNRKNAHIIVMGDMNDAPNARQLKKDMQFGSNLTNLMIPLQKELRLGKRDFGSHKYQGEWTWLDQFWINKGMKKENSNVWTEKPNSVAEKYMMTEDATHIGHRPLRSYYGYNYEGGFSDHLPIIMEMHITY